MLKKRLIGVVTVQNGWAVQSFGYESYLPLGKPECLIENLDRWGADEIIVQVIDRSINALGPDFSLLKRLGSLGVETPLIYSGGIRNMADGVKAVHLGADRIVVDALLHNDLASVNDLSQVLGSQALIASLPLSWDKNALQWLDYRQKTSSMISEQCLDLIRSGVASEALVIDWMNEGTAGFDIRLINDFSIRGIPLIAFGGIAGAKKMEALLNASNLAAVAVGNSLSYKEHAVQSYKNILVGGSLRSSNYKARDSLLSHV